MKLRGSTRRATGRPTKLVLANRLRFETLLSALSAGLIHISAPDTEAAIKRALQQVVKFLGVDRGGLDEHVGRKPGAPPLVGAAGPRGAAARHGPMTSSPGCGRELREGEVVRFSRLADLPEAAAIDRASFERRGTRSKVLIPLRAGGPILGVLSFASVRDGHAWPDDLVERLRLLSEAFAERPGPPADGALARRAPALREAPVLPGRRVQPSVGRRLRSSGPARTSPGRGFPGGRSRQPHRVHEGRHRHAFVGGRGMDERGGVPVDDGAAAVR